jgi:hypothetical protein
MAFLVAPVEGAQVETAFLIVPAEDAQVGWGKSGVFEEIYEDAQVVRHTLGREAGFLIPNFDAKL